MRVYYNNKELIGKKINNKMISIDKFKYILNRNNDWYSTLYKKSIFNIFKAQKTFQKVTINKDDIFWSEYYLPDNIIFYDPIKSEEINPFYGIFYCIVEIDGQLEIVCYDGIKNKSSYEDVSDNLQPVTDNSVIKKIANSFEKLYKIKLNQPEDDHEETVDEPISLRKINKEEIDNIIKLMDFLIKKENRNEAINLIEKIELEVNSDSNQQSDYIQIIDHIIDEVANKEIEFIVRLDSSFPLDEFKNIIHSIMKNNYFEIEFNNLYDNPSELGIAGTEVFRDFDKDLAKHNLKLGLIDSESDDYIIFIHQIQNTNKIKRKLADLELEYFGSEDT